MEYTCQSVGSTKRRGGNRKTGWSRLIDCEDGQTRALASINIEKKPDRISVFYKTQNHADKGQPWFEEIAGQAVKYISREITDPVGAMKTIPEKKQTILQPDIQIFRLRSTHK